MNQQDNWIRESLIAAKVSAFDPDLISQTAPDLPDQLQDLEQQFQETREFIDAYLELKELKVTSKT